MPKKSTTNQVATKDDIQVLRNDLKGFVTKDDLKKFEKSLRAEFKKSDKSLRGEILRVEEKVENLEEGQKRIEATVNRTASILDGFVGRVDNLTADNEVGANQTRDLRVQVDDHERRISRLE